MIVYHTGLALHQSLSSALKAAFGGCALHAPAGAALCKVSVAIGINNCQ